MADIDSKQSELDQDLDDVERKTKIKHVTLQDRLDGLVETPIGYIEIKRPANALRNLQVKCAHIEAKFYEEVHDLERKYIINAIYEPTEGEYEMSEDLKEKAKIEDEKNDEKKREDSKGIPEIWLTVFKNVDLLSDMVQEHDEPILKRLKDIKVKPTDAGQPKSFVLDFHFEPRLTKTHRMRSGPDDSDPFSFDGPENMGCTGCQIDWKKGKNVTLKTIKKQEKHKGRGTVRTVIKTFSGDSFNFFGPPEVPQSGDLDDDAKCIIPRLVLYFTGEAIEDGDDDYDEEGEAVDEEEISSKIFLKEEIQSEIANYLKRTQ
uniref:Nucleosome assembly protein 1 like 1 n=1 Tax=Saimiri boliviensis boliviensis TaxID=39432 RepID=A0A2K6T917_SAIBB